MTVSPTAIVQGLATHRPVAKLGWEFVLDGAFAQNQYAVPTVTMPAFWLRPGTR